MRHTAWQSSPWIWISLHEPGNRQYKKLQAIISVITSKAWANSHQEEADAGIGKGENQSSMGHGELKGSESGRDKDKVLQVL